MTVVDTAMSDQVLVIAEDLFTAMIDGEPGGIRLAGGDVLALTDPLHAWVDVIGEHPARALLATEHATADRLARALLGMPPDEPVETADLVDALGELANVVGGNIKSLLPDTGALTLPQVALDAPAVEGSLVHEVRLSWQGAGIIISIWSLDHAKGDAQ